jgi:outer membrane protein assembly factor BamB
MFRHDPAHSSVNPFETTINKNNVGQLALAWSHRTGRGNWFAEPSSPTIADGVTYAGTMDRFTAVDAVTGDLVWHSHLNGILSTPAVVDGVIYVGDSNDRRHDVHAIDAATGLEVWRFQTEWSVSASPTVVDGIVYITSLDGFLYALDAATGDEIWSNQLSGFFASGSESSPAVVSGKVYAIAEGGTIRALDAATGNLLWQSPCGGFSGSGPSPTVVDGVVYVGALIPVFGQGILCAFEADSGETLWSVEPDPAGTPDVTVYGGIVYMILDNTIFALDAATGTTLWTRDPGFTIYGPPTIANGVLYTPGRGLAAAFDPANGDTLWTAVILARHSPGIPAVANGRLYVTVEDERLYAFELP